MKQFMKIVGVVLVGVAVMAVGVQAQNPASYTYPVYSLALATNAVAASGSAVLTNEIALTKHDEIALQLTSVAALAGTANITLTFQRSLDKVNWDSGFTWVVPATGATTNTAVTNITVGAVGYLKLASIANANTSTVSVVHLKWAPKIKRRGDQ